MPENTNLYSLNPGAAQIATTPAAQSSNATAGSAALSTATAGTATGYLSQAKDATAQSYDAQTQQTDPSSLVNNQLNDITKQDSPLMQRARQEGMLLAAKRGLQNSSIAAGTSEGALVDRATPLAQQNSAMLQQQALANQEQTNAAKAQNAQLGTSTSQLNAQLGTDVSKTNAGLQTDVSKINADLQTDVSKTNAGLQTDVSKTNAGLQTDVAKQNAAQQTETNRFNAETTARANEQNAAAENAMRQKTMEENAALNRQFLSGDQTLDLAGIQGKYQQLISSNAAAAQLYDSYFQGISATMANANIDPARVAQTVQQQQKMLESGLALIQNMNSLPLNGAPSANGPAPYVPGATYQPSADTTPGSGPIMTTPEAHEGSLTNNAASRR